MLVNALVGYQDPTSTTYTPSKYPAWMTDQFGYGNAYQGTAADPTFGAPGVDPYSQLPAHPNPAAADTTAQAQTPSAAPGGNGGGGEGNGAGAYNGTGSPGFALGSDLTGLANAIGNGLGLNGPQTPSVLDSVGNAINGDPNQLSGSGGPNYDANTAGSNAGPGSGAPDPNANFKGGIITANKLTGTPNNPHDGGWTEAEVGEGVITKAALAHYGPGLVNKLNRLEIKKSALK